ncbi:Alpha/Beta hydrolase protein [Xylariaceae sp. FL0016]|nr:Alpha/Beta hydrolase protein [Xylariaceae sp. FL0016]
MAHPIKKAYADTAQGQIHYRYTTAAPSRRHPILFLHKSASSSLSYEPLMLLYAARGYACFAPDMPGFGQSFDPDPDPPSIAWYVDIFLSVFAPHPAFHSAGDGSGCHVFGHHSGAAIGLELAARHPAFVRSLTLQGPVILPPADRAAMRAALLDPFNAPAPDGSHLAKTWTYLVQHGGISPARELDLLQRELLDHARAWKGRLQIYGCVFGAHHDGPGLLAEGVRCPLLTLCARDDVLWAHFGRVEEARPGTAREEIAGATFGPSRDPGGIAKFLTPFLDEAEGGRGTR